MLKKKANQMERKRKLEDNIRNFEEYEEKLTDKNRRTLASGWFGGDGDPLSSSSLKQLKDPKELGNLEEQR